VTTLLQRATFRTSRLGGPIAQFMHGDKKKRRAIYAMSEQEKKELGLFYKGQDDLRPEIRDQEDRRAGERGGLSHG
jgi:hypothetical protein